ncbi:hypothetical protein Syun_007224 [Stephania yunnanensis]|uniref:Uncharacterized protein n=1 Tax=Stephania yunnanensis TaxID=152371 RepID=A0AAP0PYH0_9MAGN
MSDFHVGQVASLGQVVSFETSGIERGHMRVLVEKFRETNESWSSNQSVTNPRYTYLYFKFEINSGNLLVGLLHNASNDVHKFRLHKKNLNSHGYATRYDKICLISFQNFQKTVVWRPALHDNLSLNSGINAEALIVTRVRSARSMTTFEFPSESALSLLLSSWGWIEGPLKPRLEGGGPVYGDCSPHTSSYVGGAADMDTDQAYYAIHGFLKFIGYVG